MFERIKCYKKLRRAKLWLRGSVKIGEILHDEKMIQESIESLNMIVQMKWRILFDRKLAERYNLEFERNGFK